MEQKAAQVLSQQEREQQTRDLKQQDTKLNALTKEKGNVPLIFKNCVVLFPPTGHIYLNLHLFCIFFSGVAVRKGPKCRISTTKKNNSKRMNRVQRNTHTTENTKQQKKKKDPQKRLITGPQTERRRTGLYVHRALIREQDTDEGEKEEEAISR